MDVKGWQFNSCTRGKDAVPVSVVPGRASLGRGPEATCVCAALSWKMRSGTIGRPFQRGFVLGSASQWLRRGQDCVLQGRP